MDMLIAGIVLVLLVALAAAAALWSALKQAPEGYEDDTGFHATAPVRTVEPSRHPVVKAKEADHPASSAA